MSADGYDFVIVIVIVIVIVGGGSAGCVLAARLSEDPTCRVLLLEAGGPDRHPFIPAPAGFARMTAGPFTWGLRTVPQVHAGGREIPYAQARVLGGGGSINAQVFTRGHPSDFDRWADETGDPGCSFAEGRARGVEFARGGKARSVRGESGVVLAAGAIGLPKLMMLSGVGPAAHLRERRVEVALDLPGVRSNLTDHYGIDIVAELDGPHGLDRYSRP